VTKDNETKQWHLNLTLSGDNEILLVLIPNMNITGTKWIFLVVTVVACES